MANAKKGDKVRVHYTGKLSDGNQFDSSEGRDPLEFEIGGGQVIKGFEDAVVGMSAGDSKTVTISAADAYGVHRPELVVDVNRDQLPEKLDPEVGQQLRLQEAEQTMLVRVTDVSPDSVTLDANHPLAGEDLTFDLELVEIV